MAEPISEAELKTARKTVERALELLVRHGFSLNPGSLMLWYAYASGNHPDLKLKVDQMLAKGVTPGCEQFSESVCNLLLSLQDCNHLVESVSEFHTVLGNVLGGLNEVVGGTAEYGQFLRDAMDKLAVTSDVKGIGKLLEAVVRQTSTMARRCQTVEQRLERSSHEILVLRNRLEEVRKQAVTDPLTGLSNRRHFDARVIELVEEAANEGTPLALMMMDIDDFKAFNDSFGHPTGDHVIKLVGNIILGAVREEDLAARVGGEEFTVVLPRTDPEAATRLAERIRTELSTRELVRRGTNEKLGRMTISVGVAFFRKGLSPDELIEAADRALYQAKRTGKNKVVAVHK